MAGIFRGSSIWLLRVLLFLLISTGILLPHVYQPALDICYSYLLRSPVYTTSTFETWWTVLVYAIIESTYIYRFCRNPQLRLVNQGKNTDTSKPRPKLQRPKHRLREGLTYIAPLLILDLTLIKKFGGVDTRHMALSGNYDPLSMKKTIHGTFLAPTLHNFTTSSPVQSWRALPPLPPTSRELIIQLMASLLIYDSLFFIFHLTLHHPFFSQIHSHHHSHHEINPQITNQLDVVERLGLVLLANFSLNIIGSHVLTRTIFVVIFVWLLIDIHSGMDLPWAYDKILPRGWASGSRRHSLHHQIGTKYYEPFFNWWDDALEYYRAAKIGSTNKNPKAFESP